MGNLTIVQKVVQKDASGQWTMGPLTRNAYAPVFGICFVSVTLGIIAGIIVLSLIPTYLPNKAVDSSNNNDNLAPFFANYVTDMTGLSSLTVANLNGLSQQFNNILDQSGISMNAIAAKFVPLAASQSKKRRKRLSDDSQCEQNSNSADDVFSIEFTVLPPKGCFRRCQEQFITKVQKIIQSVTAKLTILITFTNGRTMSVDLVFCSFSSSADTCIIAAPKSYSINSGAFPRSVTTADINNDGYLDIIVTNSAADNATVLFNSGSGTFTAQPITRVDGGSTPVSVAAADVNGDGRPDIIVANYDADNIGILINKGNGKLSAQMTYSMDTGSSPRSVAAVDVNGDGKPDIIVAESGADSVGVFLNKGDGTFFTQVIYSTGGGSSPRSVSVVDVNSDGNPDIIVANANANNVGVFLNKGDGTFSVQVTYSTGGGSSPQSVTAVDVNSDGKSDIIVANTDGDSVGVFLNKGDGTFSTETTYSTGSGSSPGAVAVADINGDGKPDIIVANTAVDNIGLLLNKGDGTFSTETTYSTGSGSSPSSIAVADVNNDGKLDIIVANYGSDNVAVFLGC